MRERPVERPKAEASGSARRPNGKARRRQQRGRGIPETPGDDGKASRLVSGTWMLPEAPGNNGKARRLGSQVAAHQPIRNSTIRAPGML